MAPTFSAVDLEGNKVRLEDFKGEKVWLDFSVISCGGCKLTLDYINKDDFELTEKVKFLYINIEDGEERMKSYMEKFSIPFPVIASASEIGKEYGVNSFPSFFLIDEQGKIEEIHSGYSKEFIDRFRK
ncbi:peroxiredoxin family protein [Chondrinema litorale]|uniref:peroxiredoxin family protein n=1 Tax=Chondrinema litorale TaxID=2994555 RepID=UPI002543D6BC|nr:TlpA disulfide reductase family protein [Chondrinema litorale]UZR98481.1 TlpA disulfide reductase family protein [Chondrinema litorale]